MASRSGRRRVDHSSPLVDLDDVFADDALIDAIAAGPWGADEETNRVLPAAGRHGTPEPLTALFDTWRRELAQPPIPDLPAIPAVVEVVVKPRPKRSHRPTLAVAAAIAALLVGSTFVGSRQATPDSALWNVTAVLWPDRVESAASRDRVLSAIVVAEEALKEGRPAAAQAALLDASFEIGKVDDADGRQDLQSSLEGLWKKAAPAGPLPNPEQSLLAAGSSPSSTTSSTTTTAAQQVAALQVVVPPALTGVPIAAPEVASSGPGSAASVGVIGAVTPGGVPVGATGPTAGSSAAAIGPGVGNSSNPDTPSASTELPATPISPSTDQATGDPTTSATEQAPAPTPSLPTSTVESVETGAVGSSESSVGALTGASTLTSVTDSTAVLPTP
jgi:hypothetical protein